MGHFVQAEMCWDKFATHIIHKPTRSNRNRKKSNLSIAHDVVVSKVQTHDITQISWMSPGVGSATSDVIMMDIHYGIVKIRFCENFITGAGVFH